MDKLSAMQAYVRVVEAGTFTKAADSMGLPKPTVTRLMIKETELRMADPSRPKPFLRYKDRSAGRPASL